MSASRMLLVIDEEPTVCLSCRQALSHQGFLVDGSTDPRQGLDWARHRAYEGVLLDARLRCADGCDCLGELRKIDPQLPVLVIGDHTSGDSQPACTHLMASDHVTRALSREELSQSVHRMLNAQSHVGDSSEQERRPCSGEEAPWGRELSFYDDAWLQLDANGRARVGAVLPSLQRNPPWRVHLPRRGDLVFRGLPIASATDTDGRDVVVPVPLTGIVMSTNDALRHDPSPLMDDPCRSGWIACIGPTHLDEELGHCRPRRVILASAIDASARRQRRELENLGCAVRVATDRESLVRTVSLESEDAPILLDAVSFGAKGPRSILDAMDVSPAAKVVVIAPIPLKLIPEYRAQRLLYYGVIPFEREEIVEVLHHVFCIPRPEPIRNRRRPALAQFGDDILAKGENGDVIMLLAEPSLLEGRAHLGEQIRQRLIEQCISFVDVPRISVLDGEALAQAAGRCDHLVLLRARDSGRPPGNLRFAEGGCEWPFQGAEDKLTVLEVQPPGTSNDLGGLGGRTTGALAEAVVREMMSHTAQGPLQVLRSHTPSAPLSLRRRVLDGTQAQAS